MPNSVPTLPDAAALNHCLELGFGPCTCRPCPAHVHLCAGHDWLTSDPTRRMGVKVWQRLLYVRSQRAALIEAEGVPARLPRVLKLPW
jgi:hypothetical protein